MRRHFNRKVYFFIKRSSSAKQHGSLENGFPNGRFPLSGQSPVAVDISVSVVGHVTDAVQRLGVLQHRRRFLSVRRDSEKRFGHRVVAAEDFRDAVRVDARHPDAAVELIAVAVGGRLSPGVDVDRRGDGRPVVGHVSLEGAVEEEVIFLTLPDP